MMLFPLRAYYPQSDPEALLFAGMIDLSGSGEDPSPEYLHLIYTADGITTEDVKVSVETE